MALLVSFGDSVKAMGKEKRPALLDACRSYVNVVYLAQTEVYYKDPLFNKMVQQACWQAICTCVFVVKTHQCGFLINL